MSLGVLNNLSATYAEHNLNNTNNSLNTVLQQLSSGSKINSGADDAAGLSLVDGLQANQQALTQSETNATEGVGLLQVADGALSQVTSLLNRAVTLATEASNGTLNSSQDTAANQEYQSILSEISNIGSTTTYNQEQVFGASSPVNIYTGDSSTTGASIDSLNIRSLSSANVGDTDGVMSYSSGQSNVFIDLSKSGNNAALTDSLAGGVGGTTSLTVNYMTTSSNGTATAASKTITVGGTDSTYANTVQGMIGAINNSGLGLNASFGTATQAGAGAVATADASVAGKGSGLDTGIIITAANIGVGGTGTNGAGEVGTLTVTDTNSTDADTDALSGSLNIVGADGKSHLINLGTEGKTDTLTNLAATINAAGYGVTAAYNAGSGTTANIVFTSANPAVSVSTASTLSGTFVGPGSLALSGTPTTGAQSTEVATLTGSSAETTNAASQTLTIGANSALTVTAHESLATLVSDINGGNYGVTAQIDAGNAQQVDFMSSNSALSASANFTASASIGTLAFPDTTSANYYSTAISGTITDSSTNSGATSNTGITADSNGSGGVATISYSDGAGQALSSTDLTNQTDAESALTALNASITDVAAQDGYVGAQINTLNAVSQVLSTQQENVQSAQNAVQATDYAQASSNMSKYEILSQTGISALAQANSLQQEVTKLLQ
jgi:flagellin